jgi:hypothetical protein
MNWMVLPVLLLAACLFWLGWKLERSIESGPLRAALFAVGCLATVPALGFAAYYSKLTGEPLALYQFRALPASELAASGAGFIAGALQGAWQRNAELRRLFSARFLPLLLLLLLVVPYLKPLIRRADWLQFHERWDGEVCLQSTPYSCGPACAATLLKQSNRPASEFELARECHTCAGGTENWYLARAFRRRGLAVEFCKFDAPFSELPHPAIAGVRVQGTGHFITILGRSGDDYVVADPMSGRHHLSQSALLRDYDFTGFFLVIK